MTLFDLSEAFLQDRILSGLSDSSAKQYRLQLLVFVRWLDLDDIKQPEQLSVSHAREYLYERKKTHKTYSICQERSIIHQFYVWIRDNFMPSLDADRVPHIKPPKPDEIRRIHLLDNQTMKLFSSIEQLYRKSRTMLNLRALAVAGLLFGAGMRIGEVAQLRVQDVDICIREAYVRRSKSGESRYVALPPSIMPALRLYMIRRSKLHPDTDRLMLSSTLKPVQSKALASQIKRLAAQIGIELTSHTGRRYCISKLAHINILLAQKQAGHSRLETTQAYIRDDRDMMRKAVKRYDPLGNINKAA